MRGHGLAIAFVGALSLTGCLESDLLLELSPDGGGTLTVDLLLDRDASTERLNGAGSADQAAREATADLLTQLQGVDAWSDLEASLKSGRIQIHGKAWFRDAGAVSLVIEGEKPIGCQLDVGAEEGSLRLTDPRGSYLMDYLLRSRGKALERVLASRFGANPPTLRQLQIVLPGAVSGSSYSWASSADSSVTLEDTPASWELHARRYLARARQVQERVKAGSMSTEEGKAALERIRALTAFPRVNYSVDPEAQPGFGAGLAAATAAWTASEWNTLFAHAVAKRNGEVIEPEPTPAPPPQPTVAEPEPTPEPMVAEPEPTPEPMVAEPEPTPEPMVAEPLIPDSAPPMGEALVGPNRFEENDSQYAAQALGPGVYQDVEGDGQDWFNVMVGPGQSLRLALEKAQEANLGLLVYVGGTLIRESDLVNWANASTVDQKAELVVTGQGFYHLSVAVE